MDKLQVFQSDLFESVRAMLVDNEPWFVGSDVAKSLDYNDPSTAVRDHVDEEDIIISREYSQTNSKMLFINESGVYSLIFGSKQERARQFKHWITSEVLPALRKTGQYSVKNVQCIEPDQAIELAKLISSTPPRSLPYVLSALDFGGYHLEVPEQMKLPPRRKLGNYRYKKDEQLIAMLKQYYADGFTAVELGKLAGVHYTTIYGLRTEKHNTNPKDVQAIKDAIPLVYKLHNQSRIYEINYADILKEEPENDRT